MKARCYAALMIVFSIMVAMACVVNNIVIAVSSGFLLLSVELMAIIERLER